MSHIDEGKLHAYLDGELPERERQRLHRHLAGCPDCRDRLEQARAISRRASELTAQLEPGPVHAPAWRELEARAAARRSPAARRSRVRPGLAWAAAIVVAFGLGWLSRSYWSPATPRPFVAAREAVPADTTQSRALQTSRPTAAVTEHAATRRETDLADELEPAAQREPVATGQAKALAEERRTAGRRRDELAVAAREAKPAEPAAPGVVAPEQSGRAGAAAPTAPSAPPLARAAQPEPPAPEVEEGKPGEPAPQMRAAPDAARALDVERSATPVGEVAEKAAAARFITIGPADAVAWLGGELRTLPELRLVRLEVGPGAAVQSALPGLPAIKLVYEDAAGHEITLVQQRAHDDQAASAGVPALVVEPSGLKSYRWLDPRGYLLILSGDVSADSLRALAERVR